MTFEGKVKLPINEKGWKLINLLSTVSTIAFLLHKRGYL